MNIRLLEVKIYLHSILNAGKSNQLYDRLKDLIEESVTKPNWMNKVLRDLELFFETDIIKQKEILLKNVKLTAENLGLSEHLPRSA